jgi:hypothetical protein
MNPITFAMRRLFTVMVLVVTVVLGSALAVTRMAIDVFPNLNLPVIYVAQPYGGMDPAQMEGLLTNYYEYHFLYGSSCVSGGYNLAFAATRFAASTWPRGPETLAPCHNCMSHQELGLLWAIQPPETPEEP